MNGPLCLQPERAILGHVHADRCSTVLINFAHFMAVTSQITSLGKPVAPFTQQLLRYQRVSREGAAAVGEALHWVYRKGSHVAITTHEKETLCFKVSLFLTRQDLWCFWSLLSHKPLVAPAKAFQLRDSFQIHEYPKTERIPLYCSSFVWASSFIHFLAALDFGAFVGQPFGCPIVQNRQAMQSVERSIYWTLEGVMVDGLFFCTTLTGSRGGHTPFVQARAETSDTGAEAVKPDPGSSWEGGIYRCLELKCGVLWGSPLTPHSIDDPPTAPHVCCDCQKNWWVVVRRVQMSASTWGAVRLHSMDGWALSGADVQAPWHGVLGKLWFHCDEAQQVGYLRATAPLYRIS